MELGSILFALAMAVFVVAYVMRPLTGRAESIEVSGGLSSLHAERDHVVDAIQELDLDHTMGKVLEQDYHYQREGLAMQGARVLRLIDELQAPSSAEDQLESEIEAAVARLRGKPEGETRACHQCGSRVFPGDRFCSICGAAQKDMGD